VSTRCELYYDDVIMKTVSLALKTSH